MSIEDEARAEAERRYLPHRPVGYSEHLTHRKHFIAGAEWQASRKPEAAPSDTDERKALMLLIDPNALEPDAYPFPGDAAERVLAAGFSRSQPVQVEVTEASVKILAKHMANAASDWNHDDCDDDDHSLEHSNWEAYTGDALRALSAALAVTPAVPAPEVIPGTRAALDGLSIRTGGGGQ